MIKRSYEYLSSIPAVFLDGLLYTCIGVLTFITTNLGSDEAGKYISPQGLYWIKLSVGTIASAALNIKMYRSTSYADHLVQKQKEKNETQNTQVNTTSGSVN